MRGIHPLMYRHRPWTMRQYTGFDYSITFLSFLLYSLPVFWVAVLAKVFLAIKFNDYLAAADQVRPAAAATGTATTTRRAPPARATAR